MKAPLDDLYALSEFLFEVKLMPYQNDILRAIFDRKKKTTIRATTRAGKSYTLAIASILYAIFRDNKRIGILAPTHDKSRKIMDYITELLNSKNYFDDIVMVSVEGLTRIERLRKEVSKKRITFRNGSSIQIMSVDMNKKGMAAMGSAFDLIIVDEVGEFDQETYVKVYRMLVESPDSQLVEIGNPWKRGFFYEHHYDDSWHKIHIPWQDCVKYGRLTKEAVDDQRKNMTALEFQVLFDANFPREIENAVYPGQAIENATRQKEMPKFDKILIGCDIASGGRDLTVLTAIGRAGHDYWFLKQQALDSRDTMITVGEIREFVREYSGVQHVIVVDTVGLGQGVKDRLAELNYTVKGFKAGESARDNSRFFNIKSETAFTISKLMVEGHFYNIPGNSKTLLELQAITFEVRSDRQLKTIDPDKSPDYHDSLLLAMSGSIFEVVTQTQSFQIYPKSNYREGMLRARDKLRRG